MYPCLLRIGNDALMRKSFLNDDILEFLSPAATLLFATPPPVYLSRFNH